MIVNDTASRRRALRALGAVTVGAIALWASVACRIGSAQDAKPPAKAPKKVLLFTKSAGFEHSVIHRNGDELGLAEKVLIELGKKSNIEVTATKDGTVFDGDLSQYDAFFFYTTGNLCEPGNDKTPPMSEKGKEALLKAVHDGKGFLGSHCASDTFHTPGKKFENQPKSDPYIAMLGGEFIQHGPQQEATTRVVSPKFPGQEDAGESFRILEEWYSLKNYSPDLHVIHVLDTDGMKSYEYDRPPYPITWARNHGNGRVFFTALGHREDVWTSERFQKMLVGALDWATGRVEANIDPNIKATAPEAMKLPEEKK